MGDIFLCKEAQQVLANKHIAVIGGSNMRGLYKDMIWLLNDNSIIPYEVLGEKLEKNYPDFDGTRWKRGQKKISKRLRRIYHDDNKDHLLKSEGLHPGRNYIEPRIYHHENKDIMISFNFVTRVWSEDLEKWLRDYENDKGAKLDVIVMNSVLWDVNRWGPFGIEGYKSNVKKLLATVSEILSKNGIFVWLTAQPGSKDLNSKAMEIPGLEFQKRSTRYNVIEANFYAAHTVAAAGFDVIDLHYYFLLQQFRRNKDGIHWSPEANRYVTNMLLTHISLLEDKKLPGRNENDYALKRVKFMCEVAKGQTNSENVKEKLKELKEMADNMSNTKESANQKNQLPKVEDLRRQRNSDIGFEQHQNFQNAPNYRQNMDNHNQARHRYNPYMNQNMRPRFQQRPMHQQPRNDFAPQVFDYRNQGPQGPSPWMSAPQNYELNGPSPMMGPPINPSYPGPMGPMNFGPGYMGQGPPMGQQFQNNVFHDFNYDDINFDGQINQFNQFNQYNNHGYR